MKWKVNLLSLVMLSVSLPLLGNSNIVVQDGDLVDRMDSVINAMPGQWRNLGEGTTYSDPTGGEVTSFLAVFSNLYHSSFEAAATAALAFEYRLVAFTDNGDSNLYYILERSPTATANNYWGTYVFNPSPDRGQLILQSSHPRFDTFTGKESAYVFKEMGASFLFTSGTHRCSSPTASNCSGSSSVCSNTISGEAAPQEFQNVGNVFREGDVAHNEASMFQKVTEWVHDQNPGYYFFIQLHGFSQTLTPHVILSNGRDENTAPPQDDKLATLRTQLILQWDLLANHNESLDIEVAHDDDGNFNSLLGTTNTQGRYINGSNNPCTSAASVNTGNFIHIEMGRKNNDYYLRTEDKWPVLVTALQNTFISAPLPVELLSFDGQVVQQGVTLQWSTGWEEGNSHFVIERSINGISQFEQVDMVGGNGTTTAIQNYLWTDSHLPTTFGISLYYRLKQVDFNGNFEYSEVIAVHLNNRPIRLKLLHGNQGVGQNLKLNIPYDMREEDEIQVWLIHLNSGRYVEHSVAISEVEATLRQWLKQRPAGLYQVRLRSGDQVISGKYLRL